MPDHRLGAVEGSERSLGPARFPGGTSCPRHGAIHAWLERPRGRACAATPGGYDRQHERRPSNRRDSARAGNRRVAQRQRPTRRRLHAHRRARPALPGRRPVHRRRSERPSPRYVAPAGRLPPARWITGPRLPAPRVGLCRTLPGVPGTAPAGQRGHGRAAPAPGALARSRPPLTAESSPARRLGGAIGRRRPSVPGR